MFDVGKINVVDYFAEVGLALSEPKSGTKPVGIQGKVYAPFILIQYFFLRIDLTLGKGRQAVHCKKQKNNSSFQIPMLIRKICRYNDPLPELSARFVPEFLLTIRGYWHFSCFQGIGRANIFCTTAGHKGKSNECQKKQCNKKFSDSHDFF